MVANKQQWASRVARGILVAVGTGTVAALLSGWAQQKPTPMPPTGTAPESPANAASLPKLSDEQILQLRTDWPNLKRFHADNAKLAPPAAGEKRVVFMGDSITEGWMNHGTGASASNPGFFPGKPWIDRGISGQTTPQMLIRFRPDVIDLKPRAVVIFAGTNDIAGNTGEMTLQDTENNLASMADLARANGIKVVLCSILPAYDYKWRPGREPAPKIVAINQWAHDYAARHGDVYVDFHSAMADNRAGLPENLSADGVHPNAAGYAIMNPLVEAGIGKALGR